ncbi:MAG TPA: zf-HC2 domain-containing protein [Thermoanaerobaculia bacterium]|jgi:hypothetical protein
MPIHLTDRQIEEYHSRSLPPGELLEVDDHLAGCPDCRLRLAAGEPLSGAFAAWEGLPEEPRRAVGLDLGALMDEAGVRRARWRRWTRPAALALWAALLLLVAGLIVWLATLRRDVESLRAEVRTLRREEIPAAPRAAGLAGLEALPADLRGAVSAALRDGRLARPAQIADLLGSGTVLRGSAAATGFVLQSPIATAVLDGRPTFRWSPLPGGESYRVMVFDRDFNPVAESGEIAGTEWIPERSLPPGSAYSWQVKARRRGTEVTAPGPTSPEALFRVLAADEAAAVRSAARAAGSSRLVLGVLYARAGLLDDAERELAAAAGEGPQPATARRLLDSVRAWRRSSPDQSSPPTSTNPAQ